MENKLSSETRSESHSTPCSNGCGFFGTSATMNMCSKCYQLAAVIDTAVGRSTSSSPALQHPVVVPEKLKVGNVKEVAGSKKVVSRCGCCNKKVGIMGFQCRCGTIFCGSHRYPEEHKCEFDYKSVGRDAIAKANPLVVADKVQRF